MVKVNDVGKITRRKHFGSFSGQRSKHLKTFYCPSVRAIGSNYRISEENIWISQDLAEQTVKWTWHSTVSLVFDKVITKKKKKYFSKKGRSNDQAI